MVSQSNFIQKIDATADRGVWLSAVGARLLNVSLPASLGMPRRNRSQGEFSSCLSSVALIFMYTNRLACKAIGFRTVHVRAASVSPPWQETIPKLT